MKSLPRTGMTGIALAISLLVVADPAHAFRCKSKLVKDGMHEEQVIAACGEPTTRRHLGYAVRSYPYYWDEVTPGGLRRQHWPGHGMLSAEVEITEFTYNFGPRKLMQRLVFEGRVLVSIETIGYGYRE